LWLPRVIIARLFERLEKSDEIVRVSIFDRALLLNMWNKMDPGYYKNNENENENSGSQSFF
jgi:hypothetical protein